jgi:RNA-directed DNA polymerase
VQRHIKVKGTASPYNGDLLYGSQRLTNHPMFTGVTGAVLRKRHGTCRWCGLLFQDTDLSEIDHRIPKSMVEGKNSTTRGCCIVTAMMNAMRAV